MVSGVGSATDPAAPAPMDRRVRRSRAALTAALRGQLEEGRSYAEITVEDITERAQIARPTFYAHWPDKNALYATLLDELAQEVADAFLAATASHPDQPVFDGAGIHIAFRHAQQNLPLLLPMLQGVAGGHAQRQYTRHLRTGLLHLMEATCQRWGTTPRLPLEALAQAQAGSFIALLGYWLRDNADPELDADGMGRLRHLHEVHGLAWALGMEPGGYAVDDVTPTPERRTR